MATYEKIALSQRFENLLGIDICANLPSKLIAKNFKSSVSCFIRNTQLLLFNKRVSHHGNI